jgi:hypothetical protein
MNADKNKGLKAFFCWDTDKLSAAEPQPKESASSALSALKCLKLKDSKSYLNLFCGCLTKFKEFTQQ